MALSWKLFDVRYRWLHVAGVLLCLLGAGALCLADYLVEQHPGKSEQAMIKYFASF